MLENEKIRIEIEERLEKTKNILEKALATIDAFKNEGVRAQAFLADVCKKPWRRRDFIPSDGR